jgi:hypothetical protein
MTIALLLTLKNTINNYKKTHTKPHLTVRVCACFSRPGMRRAGLSYLPPWLKQ